MKTKTSTTCYQCKKTINVYDASKVTVIDTNGYNDCGTHQEYYCKDCLSKENVKEGYIDNT